MKTSSRKVVATTLLLSLLAVIAMACGSGKAVAAKEATSSSVVVTTLAGKAGLKGSADGSGSSARFFWPEGIACDAHGNLYLVECGNDTIRKITPAGLVSTLAGKAGKAGSADGRGAAARFNQPFGIACDSAGNLYVADTENDTIRKITPAGLVSTLAGEVGRAVSADGRGGPVRFRFNVPVGIACDLAGNLYVADSGNDTIRKITPAGLVTTLAGRALVPGSADGRGVAGNFDFPQGIACDAAGNLYVADSGNDTIRKITPAGLVSTVAGRARVPGSADGRGAAARFNRPLGIVCGADGNLYVIDQDNDTIRKITPAGLVSTLAGKAGIAGSADGRGAAARFNRPLGIVCGADGNLYVADTNNDTIRRITLSH